MNPTFDVIQNAPNRLAVLEKLVANMAATKPRIAVLEVGSYEGGSALVFSAAIAKHCDEGGSVTCVDTWKPYLPKADIASNETCKRMEEALASGSVFDTFVRNSKLAHEKAPIFFHVGTLASVVQFMSGEGVALFDLIYIDGSHVYEDVRNDITIAKRLLKQGGVMCGDDLEVQYDRLSTDAQVVIRDNRHREFVNNCHPGVTFAVGKEFGKVWCEEGVWAVRKMDSNGDQWSSP